MLSLTIKLVSYSFPLLEFNIGERRVLGSRCSLCFARLYRNWLRNNKGSFSRAVTPTCRIISLRLKRVTSSFFSISYSLERQIPNLTPPPRTQVCPLSRHSTTDSTSAQLRQWVENPRQPPAHCDLQIPTPIHGIKRTPYYLNNLHSRCEARGRTSQRQSIAPTTSSQIREHAHDLVFREALSHGDGGGIGVDWISFVGKVSRIFEDGLVADLVDSGDKCI